MKKLFRITCLVLCMLTVLSVFVFTSCGDETLKYENGTLTTGKVGTAYSASVATATGGDDITYECISYLPEGLTLGTDGTLSGTPTESWSESDGTIEIMASAEGKESVIAEFVLVIELGDMGYTGKQLPDAAVGEAYSQSVAITSDVINDVSYRLKENSSLPSGLSLNSAGAITGVPLSSVDNHKFTVVATAEGYADAEAEFTITVGAGAVIVGDTIVYEQTEIRLETATVGTPYSANLTASQIVYDEDKKIATRYSFVAVNSLPLPVGLTFEETGIVTGTALNSTSGSLHFRVKAYVVNITDTPAPADEPTLSGFVETENTEYDSVTVDAYMTVLDVEVQTNRFEAEYIDLTGKQGAGYSSDNGGVQMIATRAEASNGFSLGYMHKEELFVDFVIYSDSDAQGTLVICVASEAGTHTYTDEQFKVSVNGNKIAYGSVEIKGSEEEEQIGDFQPLSFGTVDLVEGENIIRITIGENTYRPGGQTAGPEIDYVEIDDSSAELSWRPKVYNLYGK